MPYKPKVLILGHSFVSRFKTFVYQGGDRRVKRDLHLSRSARVFFQGVGVRTVDKLRALDLHDVRRLKPDIVILEIGSNDLCQLGVKPETVGSKIEALVHILQNQCHVNYIMVCQVINRTAIPREVPLYNERVALLNQYLSVVLETLDFVQFWCHKGLRKPNIPVICGDGVHLNAQGHYALYRSYRGAILFALKQIFQAGDPTTPPA